MTDIAKALSEATVDQLVEEIMKRREVVSSIWNIEDVRSFVEDAEGAENLSEEQVEEACRETLSRCSRQLQDHLGGQGNFFLDMFWEREGKDILAAVGAPAPGA